MSFSESTRATIVFYLSILLTICEIITAISLIILLKAFLSLRRRVLNYEKNLPLVRIETQQCKPTTTTAAAAAVGMRAATIGSSKQLEVGETAERVPTPKPNRKSGCDQHLLENNCIVKVPRTLSTSGHDVSFASFNSPRDSGTGSVSTRSPQSSISYESQKMMKESFSKQEGNSTLPKTKSSEPQRSQARHLSFESGRTSSNASCGPPRTTRYGSHSVRFPSSKPLNENENDFRLSRLKTVSIEMVGLDDNQNETKSKRASRALKEMEEDASEEPAAIEDVGFDNEGYHGDQVASNRSSSVGSKIAPLASEESVSSLNSESVQLEINNNDFENMDCEEEKYVNQEIVDAMRNDSVGSRNNCSSKRNEPVYVNKIAQP